MLGYAVLGLLVGALINHAANTLPKRQSLWQAPTCPTCEKPLSPWQWIALVGLLAGKRTCPHCDNRTGWRAPIVEIATALLFAFMWTRYGPSTQLGLFTLYTIVFVLVFVIDLETRLILNMVMLPAIALALGSSFVRTDITYLQALVGGLTGFVLVLLIYWGGPLFVRIWSKMRGQTTTEVPFGFGDVMLSLYIGLVVGFPGIVFALFIGIFAGGLGALVFILTRMFSRKYSALTAIPYGPFLVIGGLLMLYFGQGIMNAYLGAYS